MTREYIVMKAIIDAVPQWYESSIGVNTFTLSLNGNEIKYSSHRNKTPFLRELTAFAKSKLLGWLNQLPQIPTPSSIAKIKEDITIHWLEKHDPSIAWNKLIAYAEELSVRTYENQPISLNLVISSGEGTIDITTDEIQKILDPIGSLQHTYLVVDKNIKFIDYKQILWSETLDSTSYKFNPEFLQPFKSVLTELQYSFHLTQRGDIVIMGIGGLLASRRKGQWYIYDVETFKNSIVDIIGNYWIGCNLFEIIYDLSYKRHGALLIYDPNHTVLNEVINSSSIMTGANAAPDAARTMLSNVGNINLSQAQYGQRKKHLLLEVASVDGAVIFDEHRVTAFGAMVKPHPSVGSQAGARTTAAKSAYHWGGKPIKISSDGDITMYFKSRSVSGESSDAVLKFM